MDGIIFGSVFCRDPLVESLVEDGYPLIMFSRRLRSKRGNCIILHNVRASRDLTSHLLKLGHRRIGFITGLRETSTAFDRLRGYREALRAAGVVPDPMLVRPGAFKAETAQRATKKLLKRRPPPTAIVASNDLMALGVIQGAGEMGRLAATWMLEIIRDPPRFTRQPVQQVLAPTLVVRRSCGAMAISRHLAPRG